jgi:spermidine/putrescine transport system ATP-binding protein
MNGDPGPGTDFLVFEGIDKSFGSARVVRDLSLSVNRGEIFSLLGPSGCGKTTLLRICAGFEEPDRGRVVLDGQDITDLPPEKRPVNTVFQNYALFPHMTVRENIEFPLKSKGRSPAQVADRLEWALDLIQMREHAHKKPGKISGGQKQRVAIARAVVSEPRLLLLDEPLAALDLKLRQKMLLELEKIHREVGITFLFVTHDQSEAMSISGRLAVMNSGVIEQVGSPAEIYEAPLTSFTAAFIGDTNFFSGDITSQSEDREYSIIQIEGLPDAVCYNDRPRKTGEYVFLSVRPEKISIHREAPPPDPRRNMLDGRIEDMAYLGAFTRYWVRCGEWLISALVPHRKYALYEWIPASDDRVFLSWHADDGYMLEKYREADESLLINPDEGLR